MHTASSSKQWRGGWVSNEWRRLSFLARLSYLHSIQSSDTSRITYETINALINNYTGQQNSTFCLFPLQIEVFLTDSSMLISETKTVLAHRVPFLRNRELIFHETVNYTYNYNHSFTVRTSTQQKIFVGFCSDGRNVRGIQGMWKK